MKGHGSLVHFRGLRGNILEFLVDNKSWSSGEHARVSSGQHFRGLRGKMLKSTTFSWSSVEHARVSSGHHFRGIRGNMLSF